MDCPSIKANSAKCNCSYAGCEKHGRCCQCLHYHRSMNQLPACFFPNDVERTYDRSFKRSIALQSGK